MKRANRRLGLEVLEGRSLLTGNVTASVTSAGQLVVQEDDQANILFIVQVPSAANATGASYRLFGNSDDTINGQSAVVLSGITSGLQATMLGGNDQLWIKRDNAPAAAIPGQVLIDLGPGNDRMFGYIINHQQVAIYGGSGDDSLYLHGHVTALKVFGDPAKYASTSENDLVSLSSFTADGPITLNMGNGNNQVETQWEMKTTNPKAVLTINSGNGADDVSLIVAQLKGGLWINTGDGNDRVGLGRSLSESGGLSETRPTHIDTGSGDDFVDIYSAAFTALTVLEGGGTDAIYFQSSQADSAEVHGGDGDDRLTRSGTTVADWQIFEYETVN
jgi:hypothetical protein